MRRASNSCMKSSEAVCQPNCPSTDPQALPDDTDLSKVHHLPLCEAHQTDATTNGSIPPNESVSMGANIRTLFRQYCETTTLRGVPRIVNTKDRKRRTLWVVFVTAFFIGCSVCLTYLIRQYMEYDVIHQPKKIYDSPRPFPSVTLCNLRPFATRDIRKMKAAGVVPVDMYIENLKRLIRHVKIEDRPYFTMLWSLSSYLSNLPSIFNTDELGHAQDDLIKRCGLVYRDGKMNRGATCDLFGTWNKIQDGVFHNCYTYTVNESVSKSVLSMEMVLYLDNVIEQTDCFDCQEKIMASQLTGARLVLHPQASYPLIPEDGINLMPGTMTDIRISVYEWSMMSPPHGRCSQTTPEHISLNSVNYSYSEEACNRHMEQDMVAKVCRCLTSYLPVPSYLINKGLPVCQQFKFPTTYLMPDDLTVNGQFKVNVTETSNYINRAKCLNKIGLQFEGKYANCRPACQRYTYKPSITAAYWPTKTFLTQIVSKLLKEHILDERRYDSLDSATQRLAMERYEELKKLLSPYGDVLNQTQNGMQEQAIKTLIELQTFERNFLSITLSRPNFDLERIEEKAVVSLTSLLSQLGGLLSIWIGLTLVCFVELMELVLNVTEALLTSYQ